MGAVIMHIYTPGRGLAIMIHLAVTPVMTAIGVVPAGPDLDDAGPDLAAVTIIASGLRQLAVPGEC